MELSGSLGLPPRTAAQQPLPPGLHTPTSGPCPLVNWASFVLCQGSHHKHTCMLPLPPVWGMQHIALTLGRQQTLIPLTQDSGAGPHTCCSRARTPSHPQPTLHQVATLADQSFPSDLSSRSSSPIPRLVQPLHTFGSNRLYVHRWPWPPDHRLPRVLDITGHALATTSTTIAPPKHSLE